MATNPFKHPPPTPNTSENCSNHVDNDEQTSFRVTSTSAATSSSTGSGSVSTTPDSSNSILKQRATCSCSNISIMQLFHEMKQKYPTVPDTVVSELVTQNCHNRPACVSKLEEAVLGTPAQTTYPAQSIHSGSLKRRSADQRSRQSAGNSRLEGNGFSNSNSSSNSSTSSRESSVDSSRFRGANNDGQQLLVGGLHDRLSGDVQRVPPVAHRPTTLTFGSASSTMGFSGVTGGVPPQPPPPLPTRPHRTAPTGPPNGSQSTSTITTTTTASSSADLGETVNLHVNVTVSPKAGGPLHVGQRHTSTISLKPEPPYSRELAQVSSTFNSGVPAAGGTGPTVAGHGPQGNSSGGVVHCAGSGNAAGGGAGGGRSSTSVNLTLRQPTDGRPHSPIHIHASPLKYTSKNFNAQAGIQSKLEVTFREGFGSFSAIRAHVPGYEPFQGTTHQQTTTSPNNNNTLQYQPQQEQPLVEQRDCYRYQPAGTSMASHFQAPLSTTSSPLMHKLQTSGGLTGPLRGGSLFATGGQIENDGLPKEIRYQNLVVAEMAVSEQWEQKKRLSDEVERKQSLFESIRLENHVLQQPLRYSDLELLEHQVLLLAAEVEQLQKEVDSRDETEERAVAAAGGGSITDGLSALSIEGGSPMVPSGGSTPTVVNRPPRPPRPPPPRTNSQSSGSPSTGNVTPGTPMLPSVPFGGESPGSAHNLTSGPSPCPASPSVLTAGPSSYGVGSRQHSSILLPPTIDSSSSGSGSGTNNSGTDDQAAATGSNQPWTCTLCTFQNHELMTSCEVCTLPKASGSRTLLPAENPRRSGLAMATTSSNAATQGTDVVVGDGAVSVGVSLLRRQHLSVDSGVTAAAAAAAATAAAVVGASSLGPSTAPPYPGGYEMPPPSFASLSSTTSPSTTLHTVTTPQTAPLQQAVLPQQQTQQQQQQQQQQSQQQPQQQQPTQSTLQNAQYQKSSIEC